MKTNLSQGQQNGTGPPTLVQMAAVEAHGSQTLATMFAELEAAFAQTARLLSPYEMHMAAFHLRLLKCELLKPETDGRPSADIVMMAATWLMSRMHGLRPELGRLLFSVTAAAVIARAGPTAVSWLEARAMGYETEGQRVNLIQLRHDLNAHFTENELRDLCETMGKAYDALYGRDKCEKVWELVSWALRHGRVLELTARCLELYAFTGAN